MGVDNTPSIHLFLHATDQSEQETCTNKHTFIIWESKGSAEGRIAGWQAPSSPL